MPGYESVEAGVAALLEHYAAGLGLPPHARAYAAAIAPALWDAFPPASRLRGIEVFAEVVSFHAMKAAGMAFDQAAFRAASLVGDMPMNLRRWILEYQRHLPPSLRVTNREPSAEAWFARMPPGPLVDAARAISAANEASLAPMRPRIRAGACVMAARKRLDLIPDGSPGTAETLAPVGIGLATAYNAAVRAGLISRRHDTAGFEGAAAVA